MFTNLQKDPKISAEKKNDFAEFLDPKFEISEPEKHALPYPEPSRTLGVKAFQKSHRAATGPMGSPAQNRIKIGQPRPENRKNFRGAGGEGLS